MKKNFQTKEKRAKVLCLCMTACLGIVSATNSNAEGTIKSTNEMITTNITQENETINTTGITEVPKKTEIEQSTTNIENMTTEKETTQEDTTKEGVSQEGSEQLKNGQKKIEKNTSYYVQNGIYEVRISVKNESLESQKFSFQVNGFDPMGRKSIPSKKTKSFVYKIAVTEGTLRVTIPTQQGLTVTAITLGERQTNLKKKKTAVYFFGDSTARFYYKRKQIGGMGEGFIKTLKEYNQCKITSIKGRYEGMYLASMPSIDVYNFSRCGQSTVSMIQKGTLNEMLCSISQGDYVFINLGHNDYLHEKVGIYASPSTYQKNLKKIISDIQISGGIPVLCSPTAMCTYRSGKSYTKLDGCEKVMKKVADETGSLYLAFGEAHRSYLDAIGESRAKNLYMYRYNGRDTTHMNKKGADVAGKILAGLMTKCKSLQPINQQIATNYTPMVNAMKSMQNINTKKYSSLQLRRFRVSCRKQVVKAFHQKSNSNRVLKNATRIRTEKGKLTSGRKSNRKKYSIRKKNRNRKA